MSDGSLRATAHLLLLHTDDGHTDSLWFGEVTIFRLSWVPVTRFSDAISLAGLDIGLAVFVRAPLLGEFFAKKKRGKKDRNLTFLIPPLG